MGNGLTRFSPLRRERMGTGARGNIKKAKRGSWVASERVKKKAVESQAGPSSIGRGRVQAEYSSPDGPAKRVGMKGDKLLML